VRQGRRRSARKLHPHGDASVYDTLVRLAQSWVVRYPLINPQGNFGSVDGDPPAAYRYTSADSPRPPKSCSATSMRTPLISPLIITKDHRTDRPAAALPGLLMNGSTGIAVGMATKHSAAQPGRTDHRDLRRHRPPPTSPSTRSSTLIPGPDFPTGGVDRRREGIISYLKTGKRHRRVRARPTSRNSRRR